MPRAEVCRSGRRRLRPDRWLALVVGVLVLVWCWLGVADAAVLHRSKTGWFRLELSGYVKNFLMVQTGTERFLPTRAPKGLADLDTMLRTFGVSQGQQDLQASWDTFRKELGTLGSDLMRVRLRLKARFGEDVSFHAAYELRPLADSGPARFLASIPVLGGLFSDSLLGSGGNSAGGGLGSFVTFTNFDDRLLDFQRNLFRTYSFRLDHELDRLYLTWALPFADVTIGRQSIVFGVGQVFRPTDVLAPFSPQEVDKEERRGVDALKIEIPLGDLAELVLVGVLQRLRPAQPRAHGDANYLEDLSPGGAARVKFTLWRFDFFAMAGYVQRDLVAGGGLSGSFFGAGLRAEAVYRYRLPTTADEPDPQGVFSASVGIDYNIGSKLPWLKLIVALEYFHNGAGVRDPAAYLKTAQGYRFSRGEVFQLGADYLALLLRWEIHPLLHLNLWGMLNLHDVSALLAPSLEYSIKQDITIFFSSYIGLGASPQVSLVEIEKDGQKVEQIDTKLQSEFGSLGAFFMLGLRLYF